MQIGVVADTEENRQNAFWAPLVGTPVQIIGSEADGLVTVIVGDTAVCEGINPSRFAPVPHTPPWWRRWWHRVTGR